MGSRRRAARAPRLRAEALGRAGRDQIIAVRTDGSGIIEPFGFAHHQNTTNYAMQPHAVPAPDGRRVLFASEWGGTEIYTYVAAR